MSLMHLNISSFHYHFNEFTNPLNKLNTNFKVIGITEGRLTTNKDEMNSIELSNYNIEHIPTKSEKSGTLLFISNSKTVRTEIISRNNIKNTKSKTYLQTLKIIYI